MIRPTTTGRRPAARRGATVAEMALVLPVVLVFLFGAIDLAQVMYAYGTVSEAARTGARYAIVHGSSASSPVGPSANDATVTSVVKSNAVALDTTRLTVTSTWGAGSNDAACPVTVTVSYDCPLVGGGLVGLGPVTVSGTTTTSASACARPTATTPSARRPSAPTPA
jgi:Flp pilus assembly protein TadG